MESALGKSHNTGLVARSEANDCELLYTFPIARSLPTRAR